MSEITISRRSSGGTDTVYCVSVRNKTDRTLHDVSVGHRELYDFATQRELLTLVFERLLERGSKEDIPSSFRLKDLLESDAELRKEVEAYSYEPPPEQQADLMEWLTA